MNENKHTPEPWSVDPDSTDYYASILDADGGDTILLGDYVNWWMTKANARRIVACVNACAGISQQYLEELNGETLADKQMVLITQRDEYSLLAYRRQNILDEVIKQRDELLKAIALAMPVMDAHAGPSRLADFRAAIASVKENSDGH